MFYSDDITSLINHNHVPSMHKDFQKYSSISKELSSNDIHLKIPQGEESGRRSGEISVILDAINIQRKC